VFAESSAQEVGGSAGGLPSLSDLGHSVYDAPKPADVAGMLCASAASSTAAGKAVQQLQQLRVTLEDLQGCSCRQGLAHCETVTICDCFPQHLRRQLGQRRARCRFPH
jgi:hypothetical protein